MEIKTKVTKAEICDLTQIKFYSSETNRVSWISRFKGERTWTVHVKYDEYSNAYKVYDGSNDRFLRKKAEKAAMMYVQTGRDFI